MAALGSGYSGAGTVTPWGGYQLECVCVCEEEEGGWQLIGAGPSNDLRENTSIP